MVTGGERRQARDEQHESHPDQNERRHVRGVLHRLASMRSRRPGMVDGILTCVSHGYSSLATPLRVIHGLTATHNYPKRSSAKRTSLVWRPRKKIRGDSRPRGINCRSRSVVRHCSPAQIDVSASRGSPIPRPGPPARACLQRRSPNQRVPTSATPTTRPVRSRRPRTPPTIHQARSVPG